MLVALTHQDIKGIIEEVPDGYFEIFSYYGPVAFEKQCSVAIRPWSLII
jgi:hypothetical protein